MGLYINRATNKVVEIKDAIFDKLAGQGLMITYEPFVDVPKHIEVVEQAIEQALEDKSIDIEETNETFSKSKKNKS